MRHIRVAIVQSVLIITFYRGTGTNKKSLKKVGFNVATIEKRGTAKAIPRAPVTGPELLFYNFSGLLIQFHHRGYWQR